MKKILLASAASFAMAGAAAADITFSGSADVGIGELVGGSADADVYNSITVTATMSGESDNGLAFGASLSFRSGDDLDLDAGDLTAARGDFDNETNFGSIFISGDFGKLEFDEDGIDNVKDDSEAHDLMYSYSTGGLTFKLTYDLSDTGVNTGDLSGREWSASVAYSMDPFSASLAIDNSDEFDITLGYQITPEIKLSVKHESDGDNYNGENTVTAAYDNGTFNASLALSDVASEWDLGLGYTANGITVGANYGDSDGGEEWDISASYDMGGGLVLKAAANEADAYYVGLAMSF